MLGGLGGVRGVLRAGGECRYSGARRGMGGKREHWGLIGVLGVIWGIGRSWGCRSVRGLGVSGMHWGGKWTGSLTTLGPSPGSQHSHWFSLGSDLPGQGQASDRNELCMLLYTFGTRFHDSLHICIYTTSSHILTYKVKKCYTDYFLCRPIYSSPNTINLTYYDTMVLIMKNYFSH